MSESYDRPLMSQCDLLQVVTVMKPGEAIQFDHRQMVRLAEGSIKSMLYDRVRPEDVKQFMRDTAENWNVRWSENEMGDRFTLRKL